MLPDRTDVLVVGAGPTGLALAIALQKAGVDHLLIDARESAQNTSRAAVVHAHTLEMLEAIDVVAPLSAAALQLSNFTVRDRDQPLLTVSFADLPSPYRHMLMIPQTTTEAVLQTRLIELGGEIRRGVTALSARVEGKGASVQVRCVTGEQTVHAGYVVGADGMRSVIREAAGIGFQGEADGQSFVLADVRMDWPLGAQEVSLFFSPAGLVVVAPLPNGAYRVVATLENAPERVSIGDIQRILDARGPRARPCAISEIQWSSRFHVHHRLANTYREGPFLLMGDAAHVHSPAGGQGMNTGLADAIVLGQALTRVLCDGASDALLDDYARLRRPAAEEVLTLAAGLTRIATVRGKLPRIGRNILLRALDQIPPFKTKLGLSLSGVARRRFSALPAQYRAVQVWPGPRLFARHAVVP